MNRSLRTPLYVRHQNAADLGSWSVARDIAWDRVPRIEAGGPFVPAEGLRDACLIESVQLVTLAQLSAQVAADVDASVALGILAGEGAKHFHALRLYLDSANARPRLTDAEIDAARASAAEGPPNGDPVDASVGVLKATHMASHLYRALAARTREPVLRDLLRLIAADKVRHGRMAADVLEEWVATDRGMAPRVKKAAARLEGVDSPAPRPMNLDWPPAERAPLRTLAMRLERICGSEVGARVIPGRLDSSLLAVAM